SASALIGGSGSGSPAAPGGTITITNSGNITTQGQNSHAVFIQSIGGFGGAGGSGGGLVAFGGNGGSAGAGGLVSLTNSGSLTTAGDEARALFAQSIGGGGGSAGSNAGLFSLGAEGNVGGNGGTVMITTQAISILKT